MSICSQSLALVLRTIQNNQETKHKEHNEYNQSGPSEKHTRYSIESWDNTKYK